MHYEFDRIIDRKDTNAMNVEGYREYLFDADEQLNIPCREDELIRMWVADMEFVIAPEIIAGIKNRLDHGILGYTQVFGDDYIQSFINWTKTKCDWNINRDHIVTSHGVIPALYDLIEYISKPGEKVLIFTPSYVFFKHAADHNDIEIITSDLIYKDGHYSIDFADCVQKAAREDVTMCIFCSPHNPTGRIWDVDELTKIGQICYDRGVTLISDEIHCDILRKGRQFTPLAKIFPHSDHIITCMAPSKTFNMAGIMFANIIIPDDELREKWKDRHLLMDNPLSIAAAQAAYSKGHDWLAALTQYLDQNFLFLQEYLSTHLPRAVFTIPDATYFAWINIGPYFSKDTNLTLFFANHAGVLLEGGNMFVSNSDGFIRLNLACPLSKVKEGIDRIKEAIMNQDHTISL